MNFSSSSSFSHGFATFFVGEMSTAEMLTQPGKKTPVSVSKCDISCITGKVCGWWSAASRGRRKSKSPRPTTTLKKKEEFVLSFTSNSMCT